MSREIELLEKQLAFWKHHSAELSKELTKEEEISNHYAELLDKTEEELQAERVKNEKQGCRKQEWISVEERLPEIRQKVLLYSPTDGLNIGYMFEDRRFYVGKPYPDRPTHWMPLPEAPKMKGGAE